MINRVALHNFPIVMLIVLGSLSACKEPSTPQKEYVLKESSTSVVVALNKDSLLMATSEQVLGALKDKNYRALSTFIAPDGQLRLSPYGYVLPLQDISITPNSVLQLSESNQKLVWGQYDGSGDTIRSTFKTYFNDFVYSHDFIHAPQIAINKVLGTGNSINNMKEIYPNSDFVEFHFPGDEEKYAGMDWASLRLVFTWIGETPYLVAIIHDSWTT